MKKIVYIYTLHDPRQPEIVRYVGKTYQTLAARLSGHLTESRNPKYTTHKHQWVRSLLATGHQPIITLILEVSVDEWQREECRLIAEYRKAGQRLTNSTDGGEGLDNPSQETRQKLSRASAMFRHSEESKRKIALASTGRRHSDTAKAKVSAFNRGKIVTAETRAKISAAHIGMKASASHIENMRAARLGTKQTPEANAKRSASLLGHVCSAETREKIGDANRIRAAERKITLEQLRMKK